MSFSRQMFIDVADDEVRMAQCARDGIHGGLAREIHAPQAFGERVLRAIAGMPDRTAAGPSRRNTTRPVQLVATAVLASMPKRGRDEAKVFREITRASRAKPARHGHAMSSVFRHMRVRHMYAQTGWQDGGSAPNIVSVPAPRDRSNRPGRLEAF